MQNAYKHQANTLKTWMQQGNMKLHAKSSKFHIEHTQNGATVQHIHYKFKGQAVQNSNLASSKHQNNMLQHLNRKTKGMDMMYR